MIARIEEAGRDHDTVGGVVTGVIQGVPAGWGEPVFNKLHADLGFAMLGINAVKGVLNMAQDSMVHVYQARNTTMYL